MVLLCDQSSEGAFQRVARADQFCQSQDESLAGTGSDLRDLLGRWLLGKINQAVFEWLMIVFSLLGALRLILS